MRRTLIAAVAVAALAAGAAAYLRCAPLEAEGVEETPPALPPGAAPVAEAARAPEARPPPASSLPSARLAMSPEPPPPPPPGELTGIAAFPPPGTKRLKRGIVVPEDFVLPEGYVRHYQATDDGQRLPAVLMFHPDIVPKGPDGGPVQVTADRLVPPELAPAGMPIQMLEVPPGVEE
jgi:hypothetical protein